MDYLNSFCIGQNSCSGTADNTVFGDPCPGLYKRLFIQSKCKSAWCGNGVCDGGETCSSCPGDCGACKCSALGIWGASCSDNGYNANCNCNFGRHVSLSTSSFSSTCDSSSQTWNVGGYCTVCNDQLPYLENGYCTKTSLNSANCYCNQGNMISWTTNSYSNGLSCDNMNGWNSVGKCTTCVNKPSFANAYVTSGSLNSASYSCNNGYYWQNRGTHSFTLSCNDVSGWSNVIDCTLYPSVSPTSSRSTTPSITPSTSCIPTKPATLSGYTCSKYSGYTLSGQSCYTNYDASPVYSCRAGENLQGAICQIGASQTACSSGTYIGSATCRITTAATGICSSGWSKSGSSCLKQLAAANRCGIPPGSTKYAYWTGTCKGDAKNTGSGYSCYTSDGGPGGYWANVNTNTACGSSSVGFKCFSTSSITTCSGGTVYASSGTSPCYCKDTFPQAYNCPSGTTLSGSSCFDDFPASYICPGGYTLSGSVCYRNADIAYYNCQNGGTLSGTTCTITINADPVYVCLNGETLNGATCYADCAPGSALPLPSSSITPAVTSTSSVTPSITPTRSITPSITPTVTVTSSPSPSFIHRCGKITIPNVSCSFTDTTANCKCDDGLYSITNTQSFTLTCDASNWPVFGNCFKCSDPGVPFYASRLNAGYSDGYVTNVTHQCTNGFWNSLDQTSAVTSYCQGDGTWTSLIECSACKIPTNPVGSVSRLRKRSDMIINGLSPAYEIENWCRPMFAPSNLIEIGRIYPSIHTCSNATGLWSDTMITCIICRVDSTKRRCSTIEMCARQACKFGPWTLPTDYYNIALYY
jgi:hypothetical protein